MSVLLFSASTLAKPLSLAVPHFLLGESIGWVGNDEFGRLESHSDEAGELILGRASGLSLD